MGRNPSQNEAKRRETTEKILSAALALFATHGFDATTISQIANAAGVSKGLAYHYFETKTDLVKAVVLRRLEEVQELAAEIDPKLPPRERLLSFAASVIEHSQRDPERFRLYLQALAHPQFRSTVGSLGIDSNADGMHALFRALGSAQPELDARFFTVTLLGIVTHLVLSPEPADGAVLLERLGRQLPSTT